MPSQRPFFLSSFIAAFRQQGPSIQPSQQPNKHATNSQPTNSSSASSGNTSSVSAAAAAAAASHHNSHSISHHQSPAHRSSHQSPVRSAGIPIQNSNHQASRRGSDSSSEGFRDAIGADKWYIGGRTAAGEEKFFKLGVVRRVRSNDGLSLDRLSL